MPSTAVSCNDRSTAKLDNDDDNDIEYRTILYPAAKDCTAQHSDTETLWINKSIRGAKTG